MVFVTNGRAEVNESGSIRAGVVRAGERKWSSDGEEWRSRHEKEAMRVKKRQREWERCNENEWEKEKTKHRQIERETEREGKRNEGESEREPLSQRQIKLQRMTRSTNQPAKKNIQICKVFYWFALVLCGFTRPPIQATHYYRLISNASAVKFKRKISSK